MKKLKKSSTGTAAQPTADSESSSLPIQRQYVQCGEHAAYVARINASVALLDNDQDHSEKGTSLFLKILKYVPFIFFIHFYPF